MPDSPRYFKDAIFGQIALMGKSFASGPRLEILDILCQGPRAVEEVARQAEQSVANTSHHLQVLRRARLVDAHKEGVRVTYRLANEHVCSVYRAVRDLATSRLLEIERVTREFLNDRGAMEPVDREILIARVEKGEVTVLDVRPPEEYQAGHIPGAVSVPLRDLENRIGDLPAEREIVAYCRGPYCVMALEAVEILRARGFRAYRMEEGVPDWKARGLPVSGLVGEQP